MIFKKLVLATVIFLAGIANAMAATLTSEVDRKKISANETLELTVRYNGESQSREPDFSVLAKDFDLLSRPSSQSNFSIANGTVSAFQSWTVTLHPKSTGKLVIPSFELDGATSNSIDITVTEAAKSLDANSDSPVFLEMEVDKDSLYIQEQLQVTYRFYSAVTLYEVDDSWPGVDNAEALKINPVSYQKVMDGRTFDVVEWRYLVFPTTSGKLDIPALRITSYSPRSQRYPRGKRFNLFSDRKTIDVKPQPTNSSNHWLPATDVTIREKPIDPTTTWRVGEPLTREITITGYGVMSTQLPALNFPESDEYRLYPDQPTLNQGADDAGIVSTRTESIAIAPNKPGIFTLPPIQVQWWDTEEQKLKTAQLPAKTLQVLPAENEVYTPPIPTLKPSTTVTQENDHNLLLILSLTANLVLIVAVAIMLRLYRKRPTQTNANEGATSTDNRSEKELFAVIRSNAQDGDEKTFREALLQWAHCYWQHHAITTLDQLGKLVGEPQLHQQLSALDQSLYGREAANVDIQWIANELKRYRANGQLHTAQQKAGDLQPLYPQ